MEEQLKLLKNENHLLMEKVKKLENDCKKYETLLKKEQKEHDKKIKELIEKQERFDFDE